MREIFLELFAESDSDALLVPMLGSYAFDEIRGFVPRDRRDIEAQLTRFLHGDIQGGQLHWAIRQREDGSCIGCLQITGDGEGAMSIGYAIASDQRGKGAATSAVSWLVKELNRVCPGSAIFASVSARNIASIAVLRKVGFIEISTNDPSNSAEAHTRRFRYLV